MGNREVGLHPIPFRSYTAGYLKYLKPTFIGAGVRDVPGAAGLH